jgi:hypothetical protein
MINEKKIKGVTAITIVPEKRKIWLFGDSKTLKPYPFALFETDKLNAFTVHNKMISKIIVNPVHVNAGEGVVSNDSNVTIELKTAVGCTIREIELYEQGMRESINCD